MTTTTFICSNCGSASYEQFTQTQVRCLNCATVNTFDTGYKPMPDFQLSKEKNLLNIELKSENQPTHLLKRMINYLIDIFTMSIVLVIYISWENKLLLEGSPNALINEKYFTIIIIQFVYYTFMEYKFGKTLGKIITKTKVISTDGSELSFLQVLGRFLGRLIPFELVSGLFTNGYFWHDSIAKTMVIDEK